MLKNTPKILGLAIATILTAYILALTTPNQAFAWVIDTGIFETGNGVGGVPVPSQHVLNSVLGQSAGQYLLHEDMKIQQLFPVYAAHETQKVDKVLSRELGHLGANLGTSDSSGGPSTTFDWSFFPFKISGALGQSASNSGHVGGPVANQQEAVGKVLSGINGVCTSCTPTLGQSGGGGGGANGIFSTNSLGSGATLGQPTSNQGLLGVSGPNFGTSPTSPNNLNPDSPGNPSNPTNPANLPPG